MASNDGIGHLVAQLVGMPLPCCRGVVQKAYADSLRAVYLLPLWQPLQVLQAKDIPVLLIQLS